MTIIEAMPKLLPEHGQRDLPEPETNTEKNEAWIYIHPLSLKKIDKKDGSCEILFKEKDKECSVSSQYVLCAVGRKPNTENLFSEDVNIKKDRGFIKTGEDLMTDEDGVYAVGDIIKRSSACTRCKRSGDLCGRADRKTHGKKHR